MRKRFEDEARVMMEIQHRNVIRVHEVYVDGALPFFIMDLAEGGSLTDWLKANGPMPPQMACDVVMQICKGVNAAHALGIVHRDIKPHNVLVNRRGRCKITDFGIASFSENTSMTDTGSGFGTLGYMAPEQRANAKSVDHRADIYSICATFYTLLTSKQQMELFFAEQEPDMLAGVNDILVPIVMRGTRYRPEERFQTVKGLAKEIFKARRALPPDPLGTPPLASNDFDGESVDDDDTINRGIDGVYDSATDDSFIGHLDISISPEKATKPKRQKSAQPSRPARSRLAVALPAMVAVAGLAVIILVFLLYGAVSVSAARSAAVDSDAEWRAALVRHQPVLNDLELLGARRSELDALYDKNDDPTALLDGLRAVAVAHKPASNDTSAQPRMRAVGERIVALEQAGNARDAARKDWFDAAHGLAGTVSVALGLSSAPD